jgi:hypothetical protein
MCSDHLAGQIGQGFRVICASQRIGVHHWSCCPRCALGRLAAKYIASTFSRRRTCRSLAQAAYWLHHPPTHLKQRQLCHCLLPCSVSLVGHGRLYGRWPRDRGCRTLFAPHPRARYQCGPPLGGSACVEAVEDLLARREDDVLVLADVFDDFAEVLGAVGRAHDVWMHDQSHHAGRIG